MPNEDNTQQTPNSNSQVIAAIRSLEDRVANVGQIIVARLNDTRPFEQQMLARFNELIALTTAVREEQTSMRTELVALRSDFDGFRQETNNNFKHVHHKLDVMNNDLLTVRAHQKDQEQRVTRLEQEPTRSAA